MDSVALLAAGYQDISDHFPSPSRHTNRLNKSLVMLLALIAAF